MRLLHVLAGLLMITSISAQVKLLDVAPESADLYDPNSADAGNVPVVAKITNNTKVAGCATTNTLVTGYPAWTNYYAGWMVNIINISTNTITIDCFEARFGGTTGYRIYTKAGTFVGSEGNSAAWTLLGTAANVTGVSTTTSSAIPLGVNVSINPGATQAFYLTRTDNTIANRHMYISGTGTAGTTVYSSDANLQVTESTYCDVYFLPQVGVRRPSFQIYYRINVALPVELIAFKCENVNNKISLKWSTATEKDCESFTVQRSENGKDFNDLATVKAVGNSMSEQNYQFIDESPLPGLNYYRLQQNDLNGETKLFESTVCETEQKAVKVRVYTIGGTLLSGTMTSNFRTYLEELELAPGVYIVETEGKESSYFKYVKQY